MINQRRKNLLLIVSFLLPFSCLFSEKTKNYFTVTFEGSWVCSSAPGVLRILKTSTSYWKEGAPFSFCAWILYNCIETNRNDLWFCGERRRKERLGRGWRRGGGIFWLLERRRKKKRVGGFGVLGVGGVLVFRISVTVGFTGCVHVLLQPLPFPHVSLMYINPDSRGQCVLGEVKLLRINSIQSSFLSS